MTQAHPLLDELDADIHEPMERGMNKSNSVMDEADLIDWFSKNSVSSQMHNAKPCWKVRTYDLAALFGGKVLIDAAELARLRALVHPAPATAEEWQAWIAEHEFYATDPANDGTCEAVSVFALEEFLAGKRLIPAPAAAPDGGQKCAECAIGGEICGIPRGDTSLLDTDGMCIRCGHNGACHALGNTAGDGKEDGR